MTDTATFGLYQKGLDHFRKTGLVSKNEECYRFFEGDQWYGLESGGERLPVYNIISPIVGYKVAMVADRRISVSLAPYSDERGALCRKVEGEIAKTLEHIRFDKRQWDILRDACVGGTAFTYFYKGEKGVEAELLDSTAVMLANEYERDIEEQDYILIVQRIPVERVRAQARANGIPAEQIAQIVPNNEDSCICVLKLWKEDGFVCFERATQTVTYHPATKIEGMHLYPVAKLSWNEKKGSARGIGEVAPIIPNQIEINRSMARSALALKNSAYPRLAYLAGSVANPTDLESIGAPIEVLGGAVSDLDSVLRYLEPSAVNPLVNTFTEGMIDKTRELSGVGQAVTGAVNPENASGAAILAAREAAALYMNAPTSAFLDFAERVAHIICDILCAYGTLEESARALMERVRVDVARCDAVSKAAAEAALSSLLEAGHISFEEYVGALDADSATPTHKLLTIIKNRKA